MSLLKKNYWVLLLCAFVPAIATFFTSYRSARGILTEQTRHTLRVVTDTKRNLLERKLYSIEQQLNLLSQNKIVTKYLIPGQNTGPATSSTSPFDEYVKSLLYNQGCSDLLLIRRSGELAYSINDKSTISPEAYKFAQGETVVTDSAMQSRVIMSSIDPQVFYVGKIVADAGGNSQGAILIAIPKEFLSGELPNTVSAAALTTYIVSSQGIMDRDGKVEPDTCVSCRWSEDAFILYLPEAKISSTWTLLSVYPIPEIDFRHSMYMSALDGMIAFFGALIIMIIIIYSIEQVQRSKGITAADTLLVQTTWNAVSEYSIKIIAGFYKHLFASAPEVRPLFKSNQSVQEKRMALMINTIVNSADSLDDFKASLSQLAKSHTHMGVKKEYFPVVVNALINSVADQYGEGFTAAHRKAWLKILNRVSMMMIEQMETYQRSLVDLASRTESDMLKEIDSK